ncbi:quinone oxidoreductase [Thozetella sp. PMI_491]|nr:quinone oxidoreductase [Thozetella sp. PMI_491]
MSGSQDQSMRAIGVRSYGPISNLQSVSVPMPSTPQGRDLLIRVKAISLNPIDTKIRAGTYDDSPDFFTIVAPLTQQEPHLHTTGCEGAGIVEAVGPEVKWFKPGEEVAFLINPTRQGVTSELHLVDELSVAHKAKSLDFVQAAVMPLTYGTAYESLIERLEIARGENAGLLIINGGGGVGSIACQIARNYLRLPVVIATASRPETEAFARASGATHVINHRKDIVEQIKSLDLPKDVPLKYAYITSRTEQYFYPIGRVLAPYGKVCTIVQAKFELYGLDYMSKSLSLVYCWLGTGPYHHYENDDAEKHHRWFEEMGQLVDQGVIKTHLTKRIRLTADGVRETHRQLEAGTLVGKVGLGVDEPGEGKPFY